MCGFLFSVYGVEFELFLFFKGNIMMIDLEKVFYDIWLNWDEELYVEFYFEEVMFLFEYVFVCEDNFFIVVKFVDEEKEMVDVFIY